MASRREEVRRRMLADVDGFVAGVGDLLVDEITAYGFLDPGQVDEIRAIVRWGVDRLLDLWVSGAELSVSDLRQFTAIGRARALDGRPMGWCSGRTDWRAAGSPTT